MTGRESQSPAEQLRQGHGARKIAIHNRRVISIASWNVRTLVERAGGDRWICRSRPQPSAAVSDNNTNDPHLVERKLDLLVKEPKRYNISITAVQETKWFESDIWKAEEHVLLHSGQPLPSDGEAAVRREGVGILLDEKAAEAWRLAGETWEALSPCVVSARLKLVRAGLRRPGGLREAGDIYMSVISAYAPTARAPPQGQAAVYRRPTAHNRQHSTIWCATGSGWLQCTCRAWHTGWCLEGSSGKTWIRKLQWSRWWLVRVLCSE